MDLSSLLSQQLSADGPGSPRLLLIVSRGVACRHDEVFATAVSHLIGSSKSSLLLAAYHSAGRYRALLDSYLRRSQHKMAAVDVSPEILDNLKEMVGLKASLLTHHP